MFTTSKQLSKRAEEQPVNLTMGNLWANIGHLSWPMFLIMILNFLVGFTDVYVAGFISPEVQASVGFVSQLYFLIIIIANAISVGTLTIVSSDVGYQASTCLFLFPYTELWCSGGLGSNGYLHDLSRYTNGMEVS